MFILAALLAVVLSAPALAEPGAIANAREDLEALRSQVEGLNDRLEAAQEDYQYAKVQLAETESSLKDTKSKLTRSEKDLKKAQASLEQRVDGLYRDGSTGLIEALFGARTFSDLINRFELLKRLGANDQEIYAQVSIYRDDVAKRKQKLTEQQATQKQLLAEAKAAKAAVQERLEERERAVRGKEKQLAQLEKEEQARQAKLAAAAKEAARQAAAAAKASRQQTSKGTSNASATPARDVPDSAVGGSVIDIAMRYMGVPYVWGGSSPSGFDCSGFTMYVFGKAGVSLPHSSRAQFGYGVAVSRSQLQPGDLVFFGSPIHHVGLYVGGGSMIHSPHTGSVVRINSIDRSNYTGARRIL